MPDNFDDNQIENMSIDEIRDELLEFIKKERSLSETSQHFNISTNELMGYIKQLCDEGFMISTVVKDDDVQLMNKGTTDFTADNNYTIEIDSDNVKVLVISDTNLGSKYQQLSFINEIYKRKVIKNEKKHISKNWRK